MTILRFSIIMILLIVSASGTYAAIAQNGTVQEFSSATSTYSHQSILSPLTQFKSGIGVQNITCNTGLQLILKAEDGSPACVKYDTANILIERGWAKEPISYVTSTSLDLQCGGSDLPSGNLRTEMIPVLMMQPNSNATICITYQFTSDWISYPNKNIYPHGILETSCCLFTATQQSSNKFEVLADPPQVNITGVYNGSKIIVMYKIHAESNSSGFYNTSVPFGSCNSYPLAVGYDSSQISASDFSYNMDIPCYNTIDEVNSVKIVSGMGYKEIQFR